MLGSRVRSPPVRPLNEANDQGTTLCRAFRILAPQPAQGRVYKGLRSFPQLHASSLLRGLCGVSHAVLKHVPLMRPSPSLFCNGAASPGKCPKNRLQKDFVVSNTSPLFCRRDGGVLPSTRPQKTKSAGGPPYKTPRAERNGARRKHGDRPRARCRLVLAQIGFVTPAGSTSSRRSSPGD